MRPFDKVTVFATYASLGLGTLERAHAASLPGWDLIVVDEAHRTSGRLGKPRAVIHDNTRIPSLRRLYMTATPRLWQLDEDSEQAGAGTETGTGAGAPGELVASMEDDPDGPFGARCYTLTLSEAIDRGICAPYQVVCLDITDTQLQAAQLLGAEGRSEQVRGTRLAALHRPGESLGRGKLPPHARLPPRRQRSRSIRSRPPPRDGAAARHRPQAFSALRASSGARGYYDKQRAREAGYNPALRQLGNRLVGILHGCLKTRTLYDETTAWSHHTQPMPLDTKRHGVSDLHASKPSGAIATTDEADILGTALLPDLGVGTARGLSASCVAVIDRSPVNMTNSGAGWNER